MSFEQDNKDFKIGSLVWAKISKKDPYWPGLVVELEDCGLEEKRSTDKICIFWIGDDRVSMVTKKNIEDFTSSFKENCKLNPPRLKQAILLSIEIHMKRAYDINLASCSDDMKISHMLSKNCIPEDNLEIPNKICLVLRKIRQWNNSSDDEEENDNEIENDRKTEKENDKVMDDLSKGKLKISEVCIICWKKNNEHVVHPFFTGGLCLQCKISYQDSVFSMNITGCKTLCIVCGNSEGKFQARESFLWLFCKKCALQCFNASEKDIRLNWNAFLKNKEQKRNNGKFIMRVNRKWQENITHLFVGKPETELITLKNETHLNVLYLCISEPANKRGLFKVNNFGFTLKTVEFVTLKDLKEHTERISFLGSGNLLVARACEINEAWTSNHQCTVEIKEAIVEFFFEFTTVISKSQYAMWLFEMPAAIQPKLRHLISRFLNCNPVVAKSSSRRPLNQYRLVWTNMNLTTEDIISCHRHFYEL